MGWGHFSAQDYVSAGMDPTDIFEFEKSQPRLNVGACLGSRLQYQLLVAFWCIRFSLGKAEEHYLKAGDNDPSRMKTID